MLKQILFCLSLLFMSNAGKASDWQEVTNCPGTIIAVAGVFGVAGYGIYKLWQAFTKGGTIYQLIKDKIDDVTADKLADALLIQLKTYDECTPEELATKQELYALRRFFTRDITHKIADPSTKKSIENVLKLIDVLDNYLQDNGLMKPYAIDDTITPPWDQRYVLATLEHSFLLALKPNAQCSQAELEEKEDNARIRTLILDKLIAKIESIQASLPDNATTTWKVRLYSIKRIRTWLSASTLDSSEAAIQKVLTVASQVQGIIDSYQDGQNLQINMRDLVHQTGRDAYAIAQGTRTVITDLAHAQTHEEIDAAFDQASQLYQDARQRMQSTTDATRNSLQNMWDRLRRK